MLPAYRAERSVAPPGGSEAQCVQRVRSICCMYTHSKSACCKSPETCPSPAGHSGHLRSGKGVRRRAPLLTAVQTTPSLRRRLVRALAHACLLVCLAACASTLPAVGSNHVAYVAVARCLIEGLRGSSVLLCCCSYLAFTSRSTSASGKYCSS
jgi:hypothetical protein